MGYEIYQDKAGEWRRRLRAGNGELVANGGEGFALEVERDPRPGIRAQECPVRGPRGDRRRG